MDNKCVNPFVHRFQFRTSDYFKIIIGTIFLLPIRVILTLFLFVLTSMIAKFSNYLLDKWKLEKQEETKWRHYLKIPCVYILRAMFFVSGFYRMKIVDKGGTDDEKEARIIVVAPHTSPFDVLCGIALNSPSVVARHDSVDIPFFGNIIKLTDPVFVERDSQSSRNNVMSSVCEKLKFLRIVFFPEGTCSNRKALVQFKSGAFKPGLPVQPVALKYNQFGGPDTLSWTWDGPPALLSLMLTLCRWSTDFELVKLPVYYPSEEERHDPELYANNVSELLAQELGLPKLCYSFDDVRYLKERVFRSPVCLKFLKLCDKVSKQITSRNGFNNNNVSNGVNGVQHLRIKNKNELFLETMNTIIKAVMEKIELNSVKDIQSSDDLISTLNLDNYPDICKSLSVKELYNCLKKCSNNPNTTHLAVVLSLCDLRVQSFWQRLENSFNLLAQNRVNGETNTISSLSLQDLLWLAFGIEDITDKRMNGFNIKISFDSFKRNTVKNFSECMKQNGKELFE